MDRPVLITGATGFIGRRLVLGLASDWRVIPASRTAEHSHALALELTDPGSMARAFSAIGPAAVVNAAGMADPDACEREPELARRVNVDAVRALAKLCTKAGARLLHFSTDLVFDGEKSWYAEDDPPGPLSVYGRSKLESEQAALDLCPGAVVLRVSNCYGRPLAGARPSYLDQLYASLSTGRLVKGFVDQWRTSTAADQLPQVVLRILANPGLQGVFHWGGADRASRYQIALTFCQVMGLDERLVQPASAADAVFAAQRPRDTSLNSARLREALQLQPLGLREGYSALRGAWG